MNRVNQCQLVANESDLNEALKLNEQMLTLVFATWCPFCQRFLPVFEKYARGREDFLLIQDDQEIVADRYEVEVVPTALYFEKGILEKRLDGELGVGLSERQLRDFIKECGLT
ncbi:MAG TPA: thioredoxin family protein [Bacillota bacterium]